MKSTEERISELEKTIVNQNNTILKLMKMVGDLQSVVLTEQKANQENMQSTLALMECLKKVAKRVRMTEIQMGYIN